MGNIVLKVNKTNATALASWCVTTPGPINAAQMASIDALDFEELLDGQCITIGDDGGILLKSDPAEEDRAVLEFARLHQIAQCRGLIR